MKKTILSAIGLFACLNVMQAQAAPTFVVDEDQTFNESQGLTELRPFVVTDIDGGKITAEHGIKISLPASYPAIFDMDYTKENVAVYGTAVDHDKIAFDVEPVFEDKGKTIVIEVKADFAAGESVTIGRLWLKDIYTSADSTYPILTYGKDQIVQAGHYLAAWSSANEDGRAPDFPYNQKITIVKNNQVKLTWEDPYDLDLTQIEILRGKNISASGQVYQYVGKGVGEFIDTDVKIGDKMEYYIVATDGRNRSALNGKLAITVTEYSPEIETETATGSTTTDTATGSTATGSKVTFEDVVLTDFSAYKNPFPDTDLNALEGQAAAELERRAVIEGYPDGEFKGSREVNRAEAMKFLTLTFTGEIEEKTEDLSFNDTEKNAWYVKYIARAVSMGIVEGYADGSFRPANTINTAEFLKMLTLTFDLDLDLAHDFEDVTKDAWYEQYVGIVVRYDLFPNRSTEKLEPARLITRDEMAVAIYQYLKNRE